MHPEQQVYFGKYRGIVKDNADPLQLGRVKCHVPEVLGHDIFTNWAIPVLPIGTAGAAGAVNIPDVGTRVWVEFEAGHVNRPIYSGGWAAQPGGVSEIPDLARGIPDETAKPPKGTDVTSLVDGTSVNEPPIPFAAVYPHNEVKKTSAGITIEVDSTPGAERVHVWHPTQMWAEMHPDGSLVVRVAKDAYLIVEANGTLHVKGNWALRVEGTLKLDGAGAAFLDGASITLGNPSGATKPVARVGDQVKVVVSYGSSGGTHYGEIISGSGKVTSE